MTNAPRHLSDCSIGDDVTIDGRPFRVMFRFKGGDCACRPIRDGRIDNGRDALCVFSRNEVIG